MMTTGKLFGLAVLGSASLITAAIAEPVAEGGRKFTTPMSGAEEVPPADPDGSGTGSITVNVGQNRVCWDFTISNIAPPHRGHIHKAPAGSNGPIVVDFFNMPVGTPGPLSGCTTVTLDRALLIDIIEHPSSYYLNLHNADFLGGAIRGQLEK
jgi:CHRD domain